MMPDLAGQVYKQRFVDTNISMPISNFMYHPKWLSIEGKYLYYYNRSQDSKPKHIFDLNDAILKDENGLCFGLEASMFNQSSYRHKYRFKVKSIEEKNLWMKFLGMAIQRASGNFPVHKESRYRSSTVPLATMAYPTCNDGHEIPDEKILYIQASMSDSDLYHQTYKSTNPCSKCGNNDMTSWLECFNCPKYQLCYSCYETNSEMKFHSTDHIFVGMDTDMSTARTTTSIGQDSIGHSSSCSSGRHNSDVGSCEFTENDISPKVMIDNTTNEPQHSKECNLNEEIIKVDESEMTSNSVPSRLPMANINLNTQDILQQPLITEKQESQTQNQKSKLGQKEECDKTSRISNDRIHSSAKPKPKPKPKPNQADVSRRKSDSHLNPTVKSGISHQDDRIHCPHCDRMFSQKVSERHITICQKQNHPKFR